MQEIHYFQRYTQPENVATNNTLLLFSRLYHYSPYKFTAVLDEIFSKQQLEAGIQFTQQNRSLSSVPDGTITQQSFKIAIETKLHANFSISQLENHCKSFSDEKVKILVSLSPGLNRWAEKSREAIGKLSDKHKINVFYVDLRFSDLIECIRRNLDVGDFEFTSILDDYEEYCFASDLIDDSHNWLRAVVCGKSFDDNFKYNLYYDPVERGYSAHGYLGIYYDKAIRGIGRIVNIVTADYKDGQLNIIESLHDVLSDQQSRIIGAIDSAKARDWGVNEGHKFFITDKIERTEFIKTTKYPLQRTKFFDLKKLLGTSSLPNDNQIAEQLKKHTW